MRQSEQTYPVSDNLRGGGGRQKTLRRNESFVIV